MSTHPPTLSKPSVPSSGTDHDALPPGTRFGEFEILRVLGVGGFGIVYLAQDHSLEREVALKEYMPASLAARGAGPQITVRSSSFAETYAIGLRSFVNEARLLARFDHPSLVKVYRFWEDNATAYMVMPFLQGVTLRDTRRAHGAPPDEAWIRSVLTPILSALELLHREGVYHRDIAPDNILLPRDGPPVLLDFGAARRVISDRTQSLTAILKPSYAPIEQYAEMTQLRQGPWTDIYALGAVDPLPAVRRAAGAGDGARRPGRRRRDREPHRPGRVAALPRGDVVDARRSGRTSGRRAASSCARCSTAAPRSRRAAGRDARVLRARSSPSQPAPQVEQVGATRPASTPPTCRRTCRRRRVAARPDQRATTTFSPTAPMPTARPTPADRRRSTRRSPPRDRDRRRRATARPPARPRSEPAVAVAAAAAGDIAAARCAASAVRRRCAAQPPSEPARSRPAPLAAAAQSPGRPRRGGNRAGLIVAGVVGVPVVAAAAAWPFAAGDMGGVASGAVRRCGAAQRPPVTLPPRRAGAARGRARRRAPGGAAHRSRGSSSPAAASLVAVAALAAWQFSGRATAAVASTASAASAPASSVVATPAAPTPPIVIDAADPSPTVDRAPTTPRKRRCRRRRRRPPPPRRAPTGRRAPRERRRPAQPIADAGAASAARVRPAGKPVPRVGDDPALAANPRPAGASARVAPAGRRASGTAAGRAGAAAARATTAPQRPTRRRQPPSAREACGKRVVPRAATSAWTSAARIRACATSPSASTSCSASASARS